MLILGIETSCDETSASLLEVQKNRIRVVSNIISSQVKLHAKYGGVVPSLAAREHIKNINRVVGLALGTHGINDVDLIAITRGPGLVSSLLVGTAYASTLAWRFNKPIVGVNHLEGHIVSNFLLKVGEFSILNLKFSKKNPSLCLIVSGGHTELVLMRDHGIYEIVGETLDDAAGEAFDKIARILDLGYPGGPAISQMADRYQKSKSKYKKLKLENQKLEIKLPRPMIDSKNFNFSFAGLKTAVLYLVRDLTGQYPPSTTSTPSTGSTGSQQTSSGQALSILRAPIAAEAQQAIVDVLVAKTIAAAEKYKVKTIMLSGGVSANQLLRSQLGKSAKQKGLKFFRPEMEYTTDNAAMIALAGYINWKTTTPHLEIISDLSQVLKANDFQVRGKSTDSMSVDVDANLRL